MRTYEALAARHYEPRSVLLALLPLAMRMAGPREAPWHALIRRNYGANHLIIGRDHASPGPDSAGRPFYGPYEAQELVGAYSGELGVGVIPFREMVYLTSEGRYAETTQAPAGAQTVSLSGKNARLILYFLAARGFVRAETPASVAGPDGQDLSPLRREPS